MRPRLHPDRPLDIVVVDFELGASAATSTSVTQLLSSHALLSVTVIENTSNSRVTFTVPVSARSSPRGWIVRALIHPDTWKHATSICVEALSLARRHLPCQGDCLPAILRVGFKHGRAGEGAVYAASKTGDVSALQAALDAGGSTDEMDEVRGKCTESGSFWHTHIQEYGGGALVIFAFP